MSYPFVKLDSKTALNFVCVASKKYEWSLSSGGNRLPAHLCCGMCLSGFEYYHTEICVPALCTYKTAAGNQCRYCEQAQLALDRYDANKRQERTRMLDEARDRQLHILSFTSLKNTSHGDGVQFEVDKQYNADMYIFYKTETGSGNANEIRHFLMMQSRGEGKGASYNYDFLRKCSWCLCRWMQCRCLPVWLSKLCCRERLLGLSHCWVWRKAPSSCCGCRRGTSKESEAKSFYCSELVAVALEKGGVEGISRDTPDDVVAGIMADKRFVAGYIYGMNVLDASSSTKKEGTNTKMTEHRVTMPLPAGVGVPSSGLDAKAGHTMSQSSAQIASSIPYKAGDSLAHYVFSVHNAADASQSFNGIDTSRLHKRT